jgi:hypothetical protein
VDKTRNVKVAKQPITKKSAKHFESPNRRKQAKHSANPESYLQKAPSWGFTHMRLDGPYGWNNCDAVTFINLILPKLKSYESMSWAEIQGKNSHFIDVKDICDKAKKCLLEQQQDDIDQVFSLRMEGRPRLFGIVHEGVFKSLWYDPQHQICKSFKKGTKKKHNRS